MKKQDEFLHLKIIDDGTGFADLESTHLGIGIRSLGKLAHEHQGTMEFYNGADKGAVIEMKLAYKS